MKKFEFSPEKNKWLKQERGYCFNDIMDILESGNFKIKQNTSSNHQNQKIFSLELEGYPVIVPFVEDDEKYFLKTMFKNRKLKKEVKNEKK